MKNLVRAIAAAAVLGVVGQASATVLSDGTFSVDIESDLEFNVLFLGGTSIDNSGFVQNQYINGINFGTGSAVTVTGGGAPGAFATYTNSSGGLTVAVTSTLLGPLTGSPNTGILEQAFEIMNTTGSAILLSSVSYIDQDLDGLGGSAAGDTVAFDNATNSVFAVDSPIFMAAIADTANAILGWDLGFCCTAETTFAGLSNTMAPVGPADTQMSIGLDSGSLGAGASTTLTFRYLVGTDNLTSTPSNFTFNVPEPTTAALLALGVAGIGFRRKARRASGS